jgi:hypothetical protein
MATDWTTLFEMSSSGVSGDSPATPERSDFIREIVAADVREGRVSEVVTRFPPEPNGYLHIGHPKSIALNFGIAQEFGGRCHLRFDDTNPIKEEQEYIDAIQEDIRWLGFDWGEHLYYASDHFHQLYDWAVHLIKAGKAYVDDLSAEEIREYRGTFTEPGRNSPWRDRSIEENLDLFESMRAGEFPDGARVLRARVDMASPNLNMRDAVLYRILHATHPRTGDEWCIYPLYSSNRRLARPSRRLHTGKVAIAGGSEASTAHAPRTRPRLTDVSRPRARDAEPARSGRTRDHPLLCRSLCRSIDWRQDRPEQRPCGLHDLGLKSPAAASAARCRATPLSRETASAGIPELS